MENQSTDDFQFDEKGVGPDGQIPFGGAWTLIKLEALEKYLKAFNNALSKQRFTRIYIDAFAGTGYCDIRVNGTKTSIEGSARRALAVEPAFHKYYFIELKPRKLAALRAVVADYPEKTVDFLQSDANEALKSLCTKYSWQNERCVFH